MEFITDTHVSDFSAEQNQTSKIFPNDGQGFSTETVVRDDVSSVMNNGHNGHIESQPEFDSGVQNNVQQAFRHSDNEQTSALPQQAGRKSIGQTHSSFESDNGATATNNPHGSTDTDQRAFHGFADGARPDNISSVTNGGINGDLSRRPFASFGRQESGQESPMAEFDVEKRRSHGQTHSRPRRSRPLGQHVWDLLLWRNPRDSGAVFFVGLSLLLSLSFFSIISIFAYLSMTGLLLVAGFVIIKHVSMALQQQTSEHPFKLLLGKDVVVSPEYAHQQLDSVLKPLNSTLLRVRNLYLADSLGQTLKLTLIMWILTYIGSWFYLLTLLTIVWVLAFSAPKFYEMYKEQIDHGTHLVLEKAKEVKTKGLLVLNKQLAKIRPANRPQSTTHATTVKTVGAKISVKAEKKIEKKSN